MKLEEILKMVDHTLLDQGSTWDEIKEICDDGMKYHTAWSTSPLCHRSHREGKSLYTLQ